MYKEYSLDKEKVWLEVEDFSKATEDWKIDSFNDGIKIGITAWDSKDKNYMLDEHIVAFFPELEDIGIVDEVEGFMTCEDEISLNDLKDKIINLGFQITD